MSASAVRHGAFLQQNGVLTYLAGLKSDCFPHVDAPTEENACAVIDFETFLSRNNNKFREWSACQNKIKKCPFCSKAVAYTMNQCNGCSADISSVAVSYIPNIFLGFIFGVGKDSFPFTISIRSQCENFLVFDDLVAIASCHLNAIPTSAYIPDVRYLLSKPSEGKKMVLSLLERCWAVVEQQFASNQNYKRKLFYSQRNGGSDNSDGDGDAITLEEMRKHAVIGFNFPPSQYQLHLQFMLPPFFPVHYKMCLENIHFTKGRFIPVEYVLAILETNIAFPLPSATDATSASSFSTMSIEEVFSFFDRHAGISYEKIWQECYTRYGSSHCSLANWQEDDFSYLVEKDKIISLRSEGKTEKDHNDLFPKEKEIQAQDKLLLQNYGRPYKANGQKPNGTYYKFAKINREDLIDWTQDDSKQKVPQVAETEKPTTAKTALPRKKRVSVFLQSLHEFRKFTPQFSYTEWEQFEEYNEEDLKRIGLPQKEATHLAKIIETLFPPPSASSSPSSSSTSLAARRLNRRQSSFSFTSPAVVNETEVYDVQQLTKQNHLPQLKWSEEVLPSPASQSRSLSPQSLSNKVASFSSSLANLFTAKTTTATSTTTTAVANTITTTANSTMTTASDNASTSAVSEISINTSAVASLSASSSSPTQPTPPSKSVVPVSSSAVPASQACAAFCPVYGMVWAGMNCKTCGCSKKSHLVPAPTPPLAAPPSPGWLDRMKDLRRIKSGQ